MKILRIESSKFTPGIILDPQSNVLEFYGFSLPENALEFYQPVLDWLNEYKKEILSLTSYPEINVIFKYTYFNSATLRKLIEIFSIFSELYQKGVPVVISWQFDSEDPAMADSGREIGELAKVPVNLIAYN